MGWTWELITNPFAAHPLPPEVLENATFEKEMDTFAALEERGKPETSEAPVREQDAYPIARADARQKRRAPLSC